MAKLRKMIKLLESEGWKIATERSAVLQMEHSASHQIVTLPAGKFDLPDALARDFLNKIGSKGKLA